MRLLHAITTLVRSGDSFLAFVLLATVVVLFPPPDGGLRLVVAMTAAIALTGVALYTIRQASRPGTRLARMGSGARATAALGASASVLMIVDAAVAAIG